MTLPADFLQQSAPALVPGEGQRPLLAGAFAERGLAGEVLVSWRERAAQVGARGLGEAEGRRLLLQLWGGDRFMGRLPPADLGRLAGSFEFALVPAGQEFIRQGEYGDFMVVLLSGSVAVDRTQPWGAQVRLAESRPGDSLGEMSLLDSGMRVSQCITLADSALAVLDARALDELLLREPALAARLVVLLARKLSLRLRAITARLQEPMRVT